MGSPDGRIKPLGAGSTGWDVSIGAAEVGPMGLSADDGCAVRACEGQGELSDVIEVGIGFDVSDGARVSKSNGSADGKGDGSAEPLVGTSDGEGDGSGEALVGTSD